MGLWHFLIPELQLITIFRNGLFFIQGATVLEQIAKRNDTVLENEVEELIEDIVDEGEKCSGNSSIEGIDEIEDVEKVEEGLLKVHTIRMPNSKRKTKFSRTVTPATPMFSPLSIPTWPLTSGDGDKGLELTMNGINEAMNLRVDINSHGRVETSIENNSSSFEVKIEFSHKGVIVNKKGD
jgi:hypothetical protein